MGVTRLTWQPGAMPAADTVLLPLAVGLTLLGILLTIIAGRRGHRGRAVQGVGLALAPVALYFSGLLRLLWDAVVAVGNWAGRIILSPAVWFGLSLLGVCVVLWVVGGFLARRAPRKTKAVTGPDGGARKGPAAGARKSVAARPAGKTNQGQAAPPVDDDMAEIEALLKNRGIS